MDRELYYFESYMFNAPPPERTFDPTLEAIRFYNEALMLGLVFDNEGNIELAGNIAGNNSRGVAQMVEQARATYASVAGSSPGTPPFSPA